MSRALSEQSAVVEQWKKKYRDSVRELDDKEIKWRETETQLQKNLLRLLFSFKGLEVGLDQELHRLQSGLRKITKADKRSALIDDVASKIVAFVARNGIHGADSGSDARELFTHLLDSLELPERYATESELLRARIAESDTAPPFDNVSRLSEMLNEALSVASVSKSESHDVSDTFQEFLSRISLPGSIGEKVSALQERSLKIKSDIERLTVIDDTIALLNEELDQDAARHRSVASARALIRELIEWMTLPSQVEEDLKGIQTQLNESVSEQELSQILRDLGYTVSQFHSNLMSELSDVEYYLKNIAIRLKELQLGIEESFQDQHDSFSEQQTLAAGIADQVRLIEDGLQSEHDLSTLKSMIDAGLQEIGSRMQGHIARGQERVTKGEQRLKDLSDRLRRMDEESTRLRAQVRQERERAQQDALTEIPNRAAFDERINAEIARHKRHGRELSLAVIDIDKFKRVNDNFGHKAGDKVLKSVAEICAANVRASDFLARYGGEEFVLVLPETPLVQAHHVAEKLRNEVAGKGFYYDKTRVPITVSVGIAQFTKGEGVDEVFQRADRALYAAKERGRNCCVTEVEIPPQGDTGSATHTE